VVNPSWYKAQIISPHEPLKSTLQHSIGIGTAFSWIPASAIEMNRCIHSCRNKRISSAHQVTRITVSESDSQPSLMRMLHYIPTLFNDYYQHLQRLRFFFSICPYLECSRLIIYNSYMLKNTLQALYESQMRGIFL